MRKNGFVTNGEKMSSLLKQFGLEKKCIGNNKEMLENKLVDDVDWLNINDVLVGNRRRSQFYLQKNN